MYITQLTSREQKSNIYTVHFINPFPREFPPSWDYQIQLWFQSLYCATIRKHYSILFTSHCLSHKRETKGYAYVNLDQNRTGTP